jgi:hypothetical protein
MEAIVHYELLNTIVNNLAMWSKQSSKNARVDDME